MMSTQTLENELTHRNAVADFVRAETVRVFDSLCAEPRCVLAVGHAAGHWRPGRHWWTDAEQATL